MGPPAPCAAPIHMAWRAALVVAALCAGMSVHKAGGLSLVAQHLMGAAPVPLTVAGPRASIHMLPGRLVAGAQGKGTGNFGQLGPGQRFAPHGTGPRSTNGSSPSGLHRTAVSVPGSVVALAYGLGAALVILAWLSAKREPTSASVHKLQAVDGRVGLACSIAAAPTTGLKLQGLAATVHISAAFDGGNIIVEGRTGNDVRLQIRPDPYTEVTSEKSHYQWFV